MASVFTTKVEVANLAIAKIGANDISSFEEDTKESQLMKRYYELYLNIALSTHNWNFCMTHQQASLLSESPLPNWSYAYELPSDSLNNKAFFSNRTSKAPFLDYELFENNILCTNTGNGIWVLYQKRVYETRFPAYFIEYVASYLAINLAPLLGRQFNTRSTYLETTFGENASNVFNMACAIDSSQSPSPEYDTFYVQNARESY